MNIFNYLTPKSETYYLDSKCTIRQALEKFDFHKFSVVPLLDECGHFISTLFSGDLLRYIKNDKDFDVSEAEDMTIDKIEKYRPYKYLKSGASLNEIYLLSLEQNFIPVVDDRNMYIGIIKRKDVLQYIYKRYNIFEE